MANPWHHAVSSARKWGGMPEDYLAVHQWFDRSKRSFSDFRHRALYHHTEGIFDCEVHFGPTITLSTCSRCGDTQEMHDENEGICPGHEPGPNEPMGISVYCDGSCQCPGFRAKLIPTRWVGELHVQEDLGFIPHAAQYLQRIAAEPWMFKSRKLSRELDSQEAEKAS